MAAKTVRKPAAASLSDIDDDDDDVLLHGDDETDESRLLEIIRQCSGDDDLRLTVSRIRDPGAKGPRLQYCFTLDPTEAPDLLEKIKQEAGGGVYRVKLVRGNGKYVTQKNVAVEGIPELTSPKTGTLPQSQAYPAATPSSLESTLQAFIAVSTENQKALIAALNRDGGGDRLEMFKQFAEIMGAMRAAPAEASGQAMIGTIREAMKLAGEVGGSGGPPEKTGLWDVAKAIVENPGILDGLKAIAENLKAQNATPVNGQRQIAAPPGPAIPAPAPPAPGQAAPPGDDPQALLDQYVPLLIRKANVNADPALYAEFLLDNLPPDLSRALMQTPNLVQTFSERFPEIVNYKSWFDSLLAEMRAMVETDSAVAAGPGARGGEPQPANHAAGADS